MCNCSRLINVDIKVENGEIPIYATKGSAGCDIKAAIPNSIQLNPGETKIISTGIRIKVPVGFECQVRPRSGLSAKTGLRVSNSPGTIDSDYRGIVGVILTNIGNKIETINPGDRIAQLVFCPVYQAKFVEVNEFIEDDINERGEGGFGHTGI